MAFRTPPTNPFSFLDPQQTINQTVQGFSNFFQRQRDAEAERTTEFRGEQDALIESMQRVLAAPDLTDADRGVIEQELTELEGIQDHSAFTEFLTRQRALPGTPENFTGPFSAGQPTRNFRGILGEIAGRVTLAEEERTRQDEKEEEADNFVRETLFPIWTNLELPQEDRRNMLALFLGSGGTMDPQLEQAAFAATGITDRNALALVQEELRGKALVNDGQVLSNEAQSLGNQLQAAILPAQIARFGILVQADAANLATLQLSNEIARDTQDAMTRLAFAQADTAEAQAQITMDDVGRTWRRFFMEEQEAEDMENFRQAQIEQIRAQMRLAEVEADTAEEDRWIAEILAARNTGIDANLSDDQKRVLGQMLSAPFGTAAYDRELQRWSALANDAFESQQQISILEASGRVLDMDLNQVRLNVLESQADWEDYIRDRQRAVDVFNQADNTKAAVFQAQQAGDIALIDSYLRYLQSPATYTVQAQLLDEAGITARDLLRARELAEANLTRIQTDQNLRLDVVRAQLRVSDLQTEAQQFQAYRDMGQYFGSPEEVDQLPESIRAEIGEDGLAMIRMGIRRRNVLTEEEDALLELEALTQGTPTNLMQWQGAYMDALGRAGITDEQVQLALVDGWLNQFRTTVREDKFNLMERRQDIALIEARIGLVQAQTIEALTKGEATGFDSEFFQETRAFLEEMTQSLNIERQVVSVKLAANSCGALINDELRPFIAEGAGLDPNQVAPDVNRCNEIISNELDPLITDLATIREATASWMGIMVQSFQGTTTRPPPGSGTDFTDEDFQTTVENGLMAPTRFEEATGLNFPFRTDPRDLNIFSFGPEDLNAAGNAVWAMARNAIAVQGGRAAPLDATSAARIRDALIRFYGSEEEATRQIRAIIAQQTEDFGLEVP